MTRVRPLLAAFLMTAAASPAWAQDALSQLPLQNMLSVSNAAVAGHVIRTVAARAGGGEAQGGASTSSGAARTPIQQIATSYTPTDALQRETLASIIGRLSERNPKGAGALEQQLANHDYGTIYANIIAPLGLKRGDVADALTAYTLLGWSIANKVLETRPEHRAQAQAVRRQIAAELAGSQFVADPTTRAKLGEELALMFVVLHAGWQAAQREGNLEQYSNGVADLFKRQTGKDPRSLVLTDAGLRSQG